MIQRRVALLLLTLGVVAIAGPWAAPYLPDEQHRAFMYAPPMPPRLVHRGSLRPPFVYPLRMADRLELRYDEVRSAPQPLPWFAAETSTPAFLIGADSYGRDLLSRLLYGARVSISLGLTAVAGTLLLGTLIGGIAGYAGGWIDALLMRLADLIVILPLIYVVLILRAALPLVLATPTIFLLMVAIFALVGWPFVARGVRNIVASEREREYVTAARSLGASNWCILSRHLLPACSGHLLVQATILLPAFVLAEATLSYVGLGFPEHVATWGTMLIDAANVNAMTRFPWTLAPAGAIFLVVLGANLAVRSAKIDRRAI